MQRQIKVIKGPLLQGQCQHANAHICCLLQDFDCSPARFPVPEAQNFGCSRRQSKIPRILETGLGTCKGRFHTPSMISSPVADGHLVPCLKKQYDGSRDCKNVQVWT